MDIFNTPQDLLATYNAGFVGAYCDPELLEEVLASLPQPSFAMAGAHLYGTGRGKLSTPFRSVYALSPVKPYLERQETGDCVSHSTRNAADVSRAVQIHVQNMMESFVTIGATEGIYGSRGHGGQGMSCAGAARWVNSIGGILLRQNYPGVQDFSTYKGNLGAGWGSRGVPKNVTEAASKNPVRTITEVSTVEQARDALANGYGVSVCSSQGFSSKRDDKGFAAPQGSWNHAMAWTACDDTGSEPAFLVQNSWGKFNDGGHPEWGPIPDGSFLIKADVAARMLRGGGSFALSAVTGFPMTKLPDYGFDY